MFKRVKTVLLPLLFSWGLFSLSAAAQVPEVFSNERTQGVTVANSQVYWYTTCGDDFSPPATYMRHKAASALAGDAASNDYAPGTCPAQRIASSNVAFDSGTAYWLGGDGSILAMRADSARPVALAHATLSSIGGFPSCCSIAVDSQYVYWSEPGEVARVAKTGGAPEVIVSDTSRGLRDLRVTSGGQVYYLTAGELWRVQASAPTSTRSLVFSHVTAYTIDESGVAWAAQAGSSYAIHVQDHSGSNHRLLHLAVSSSLIPDAVALDASNVYWHVHRGPIFRVGRSGGSPVPMTADLLGATMLASDGTALFWTDYQAVLRMAISGPGVAADRGNIRITGIQAIQAIQTDDNAVPLVGYKPTVIRVYVQSTEDVNGPWHGVEASLQVSGASRLHTSGPITISPSGSDRRAMTDSFTFLLDRSETAPGDHRITVTLFPPLERTQSTTTGNQQSLTLHFGAARYLNVWGWTYANTNNGNDPSPADGSCVSNGSGPNGMFLPFSAFEAHRRYVASVFPISEIYLYELPGSGTQMFDNRTCGGYQDALSTIVGLFDRFWPHGAQHGFMLQPDSGGYHGTCCFGNNGNQIINSWNTDPGGTFAQETAHSYGGLLWTHTADNATHYPRTDHSYGSANDGPLGNYFGVRALPAQQVMYGQNADGSTALWDFMSYHASSVWVSPYTYCHLLNYMSHGTEYCPSSVEGGGPTARLSLPSALFYREAAFRPPDQGEVLQQAGPQQMIYISGMVRPDGSIALNPFEITTPDKPIQYKPAGKTYTLVFKSASGQELADYPFDATQTSMPPVMGSMPGIFDFYVPWVAETRSIFIRNGGKDLAVREVATHPPDLALLPVSANDNKTYVLSWKSRSYSPDIPSHSVWYSMDGGQQWFPLAANLRDTTYSAPLDSIPGGSIIFRVLASDGVNTTEARTTAPISVPTKPPVVTIFGLEQGAALKAHQEVLLRISLRALQGPIQAENVVWQDESGNTVGTGTWIVPQVLPGKHRLTVTATDRSGLSGSASVSFSSESPNVTPEKTTNLPATAPKPAQEFRVTEAVLKADDPKVSEECPITVRFGGYITTNGPGTVKYTLTRSDGATGPVETLEFKEAGTQHVQAEWTLGDAKTLPVYKGWEAIKILAPNEMDSSHATGEFMLSCSKPQTYPVGPQLSAPKAQITRGKDTIASNFWPECWHCLLPVQLQVYPISPQPWLFWKLETQNLKLPFEGEGGTSN